MSIIKKIQSLILCLLILLPFNVINADRIANKNPLEFSLSTSSQVTHYNFSVNTYETKTGQVGIDWYEHFNDYFHAGLEIGYIDVNQGNNPLVSAKFTSGEYTGLLLRFLPLSHPFYALTLDANYRYTSTQGIITNQETRFVWSEALFSAELQFKPTTRFDLFAAAEYQIVDGKQQDSGTITQTSHFKSTKHEGYRFGINFRPDQSGVISVEWLTGFRDGIRVYLKRKY